MLLSIKSRIIIFYIVIFVILLFSLSIFLYTGLKIIIFNSIDLKLLAKAHDLAIIVDTYSDDIKNEDEFKHTLSNKPMREYNFPEADDFFLQIRYFDGEIIKKSMSLENNDLPFTYSDKTNFKTLKFKGLWIRKLDLYIPPHVEDGREEKGLVIQCGEVIQKDITVLEQFKIILIISIFFILISSTLGANLIARKAISPVNEISETISNVSEANLSERIDLSNIPAELKNIASSFNRTIDLLEKSFTRQKQFIADASHELRTPLATIMSYSEINLRKERSGKEYREALSSILKATQMMSGTIQKLLVLARLTDDTIELNFKKIYIDEIINDVIKLLNPLAEEKNIKLKVSFSNNFVISGDRENLIELFMNIIDNGIKYNIPHGNVNITIKREAPWVITEIKDSGIGIANSEVNKIFDRFYRVDKSRSRELGGTGLGLSICNEIVKLHRGKIELQSHSGTGTEVKVFLPEAL